MLTYNEIPIGYGRFVKLKDVKSYNKKIKIIESSTFFIKPKYRNNGYSKILRSALLDLKKSDLNEGSILIVGNTHNLYASLSVKKVYFKYKLNPLFCPYSEFPSISSLILYRRLIKRKLSIEDIASRYLNVVDKNNFIKKLNSNCTESLKSVTKMPHMMYVSSDTLARKLESSIKLAHKDQKLLYCRITNNSIYHRRKGR